MRKLQRAVLALNVLLLGNAVCGAVVQWTWVGGTSVFSNSGAYSGNPMYPASRTDMGYTTSYNNSALYIHAGFDTNSDSYADLWSLDLLTLRWTLLSGDSTLSVVPSYSGSQQPGSRAAHS